MMGHRRHRAGKSLPFIALLLAAVLCGWWIFSNQLPTEEGHRWTSRALGWLSMLLMLAAGAFTLRKRFAYQGGGRLSLWLAGHVYIGLLAILAVLLHSGFRTGGYLASLLLFVLAITTATGVAGWWISKNVPKLLTAIEESPAMIEDLLEEKEESRRGLHELARDGSEALSSAIRELLLPELQSWRRILRLYSEASIPADAVKVFIEKNESGLSQLTLPERAAFHRATAYALRSNRVSAEIFLHRLLRAWVAPHIVFTCVTYALMTFHIAAQLHY